MISDADLVRFQELYKKHYSKDITKAQALDKATKLVNLARMLQSDGRLLIGNKKELCMQCMEELRWWYQPGSFAVRYHQLVDYFIHLNREEESWLADMTYLIVRNGEVVLQ